MSELHSPARLVQPHRSVRRPPRDDRRLRRDSELLGGRISANGVDPAGELRVGDRCPGRVVPRSTPGEAERLRHRRGDVSVAAVRAGCQRGGQDLVVPEAGPVDLGEVQDVRSCPEPVGDDRARPSRDPMSELLHIVCPSSADQRPSHWAGRVRWLLVPEWSSTTGDQLAAVRRSTSSRGGPEAQHSGDAGCNAGGRCRRPDLVAKWSQFDDGHFGSGADRIGGPQ